ncbi:hypothetical protein [Acinetobacter baumannii]
MKKSTQPLVHFASASLIAVCTFKPAMKDGVPQQDWYEIEYPFVIE